MKPINSNVVSKTSQLKAPIDDYLNAAYLDQIILEACQVTVPGRIQPHRIKHDLESISVSVHQRLPDSLAGEFRPADLTAYIRDFISNCGHQEIITRVCLN